MENQTGTFGTTEAYPISDADGLAGSGFTFTVKNHCEEDVAYVIGIDSVEVATTGTNGYMLDGSIKVSIDNTTPRIFGDLEDIDHVEANDTYVIRNSKKINTAVVPGMKDGVEGTDTHTIKAWIDADAPVSENNKVFGGRVFITGGQLITNNNPIAKPTDDSCFTMSGTEIVDYKEELDECGDSVVIPMYVGENAVTTIDSNAFKATSTTEIYYDATIMSSTPKEVGSVDLSSAHLYMVKESYEKGAAVDFANLQNEIGYAVSLTDDATINASLQELASGYGLDLYTKETAPELLPGQLALYQNAGTGEFIGGIYLGEDNVVSIKSLDLSQAYNLELIEPSAFSNVPATEYDLDNYAKYSKSLTSLTFGNNEKRIKFGHNAFANIDVDNLDLYASYVAKLIDNSFEETIMPFGNAKINNLNVYATTEYDKILVETVEEVLNNGTPMIYIGINADNLTFNEGIKYIMSQILLDATIGKLTLPMSVFGNLSDSALLGASLRLTVGNLVLPEELEVIPYGCFRKLNVNNVELPSTLKVIGESAFRETPLKEIRIPASVTEIGSSAFFDHTNNLTVIFEGRSNLDGLSLGASWDYSYNKTTTIEYD